MNLYLNTFNFRLSYENKKDLEEHRDNLIEFKEKYNCEFLVSKINEDIAMINELIIKKYGV